MSFGIESTRFNTSTITTNKTDSDNNTQSTSRVLSDVGNTTINLPPASPTSEILPLVLAGGLALVGIFLLKGGR